jgi:hypothetical protein
MVENLTNQSNNDIDTRQVAKQLLEVGDTVHKGVPVIVQAIKDFVLGIFKDLKKIVGDKPTEEQFIKIISDYAELRYVSSNPLIEMVDGIIFHEIFKLIAKLVTKIHKDWYSDLWDLFEKLEDKVAVADL